MYGVVAVSIVAAGFVFFLRAPTSPQQTVIITLTGSGYEPAEVLIAQGTQVVFRTTEPRMFWPASNLHPSHGIYPEFDPKRPLEPSETWAFVFDTVGEWRFHDHLAPYYTGTITVTK